MKTHGSVFFMIELSRERESESVRKTIKNLADETTLKYETPHSQGTLLEMSTAFLEVDPPFSLHDRLPDYPSFRPFGFPKAESASLT